MTPPEWGSTPEDVSKIIVRHLDLAALARFGAVCRAWQQVGTPRLAVHALCIADRKPLVVLAVLSLVPGFDAV